MHIIREKTDCNQNMKCGYLVPPKVWRTFFFNCSPRLIPKRESMLTHIVFHTVDECTTNLPCCSADTGGELKYAVAVQCLYPQYIAQYTRLQDALQMPQHLYIGVGSKIDKSPKVDRGPIILLSVYKMSWHRTRYQLSIQFKIGRNQAPV